MCLDLILYAYVLKYSWSRVSPKIIAFVGVSYTKICFLMSTSFTAARAIVTWFCSLCSIIHEERDFKYLAQYILHCKKSKVVISLFRRYMVCLYEHVCT